MLQITTPSVELWDDVKQEFKTLKSRTLQLEHSLVSLSKWESKWRKPFLSTTKTDVEMIDYIECMTITQNVPPETYLYLSNENVAAIEEYINAPMTATVFSDRGGGKREIVTSEVIYYWMIAQNVPMECQKWHLNRLLTLIRVCSIKNQPSKKMSNREIMSRNSRLNAARKMKHKTRG